MSAKYRAAFRKTLCGIQGAKATVGGGPQLGPKVPDRLLPRYGSQISNGRTGGGQGQRRRSEQTMPTQHNVMVKRKSRPQNMHPKIL